MNIVEVTETGFNITLFSKDRLSCIGSLFLLKTDSKTNNCFTGDYAPTEPYELHQTEQRLEKYKNKLYFSNWANKVQNADESVSVYLNTNILSAQKETTLHIDVKYNVADFSHIKKILLTLMT